MKNFMYVLIVAFLLALTNNAHAEGDCLPPVGARYYTKHLTTNLLTYYSALGAILKTCTLGLSNSKMFSISKDARYGKWTSYDSKFISAYGARDAHTNIVARDLASDFEVKETHHGPNVSLDNIHVFLMPFPTKQEFIGDMDRFIDVSRVDEGGFGFVESILGAVHAGNRRNSDPASPGTDSALFVKAGSQVHKIEQGFSSRFPYDGLATLNVYNPNGARPTLSYTVLPKEYLETYTLPETGPIGLPKKHYTDNVQVFLRRTGLQTTKAMIYSNSPTEVPIRLTLANFPYALFSNGLHANVSVAVLDGIRYVVVLNGARILGYRLSGASGSTVRSQVFADLAGGTPGVSSQITFGVLEKENNLVAPTN